MTSLPADFEPRPCTGYSNKCRCKDCKHERECESAAMAYLREQKRAQKRAQK